MYNYFFEFQNRTIYIFIMFFSLVILSYCYKEALFYFLVKPVFLSTKGKTSLYFIYTHITEVFMTYFRVSLLSGLYLTLPYLFFQAWKFFLPGFYYSEQSFLNAAFFYSFFIWLITSVLIFLFFLPYLWLFFSEFQLSSIPGTVPFFFEAKLDEYIFFVTRTFFGISLLSQFFSLTLYILFQYTQKDLKNIKNLRSYLYVTTFIFACLVTPPDVISQLIIAIPFILFYEALVFYLLLKNEYCWQLKN